MIFREIVLQSALYYKVFPSLFQCLWWRFHASILIFRWALTFASNFVSNLTDMIAIIGSRYKNMSKYFTQHARDSSYTQVFKYFRDPEYVKSYQSSIVATRRDTSSLCLHKHPSTDIPSASDIESGGIRKNWKSANFVNYPRKGTRDDESSS